MNLLWSYRDTGLIYVTNIVFFSLIDIPVIPDLEEQQDDDIQVKVAIAPK